MLFLRFKHPQSYRQLLRQCQRRVELCKRAPPHHYIHGTPIPLVHFFARPIGNVARSSSRNRQIWIWLVWWRHCRNRRGITCWCSPYSCLGHLLLRKNAESKTESARKYTQHAVAYTTD